SPDVDSHTFYHRGVGRWLHRFGSGATVQTTLSAGYDVPFQFTATHGNTPRSVDVESLTYALRSVARVPLRTWLRLDGGVDFEGNRWGPIQALFGPEGPPREGDPGGFGMDPGQNGNALTSDDYTLYSNSVALFLATVLQLADQRLVITPQLRLEMMSFSA